MNKPCPNLRCPSQGYQWDGQADTAVLYLRVSTLDQSTANQERELCEIAGHMGCEIVKVYKEHGVSGAKGRDKRPAFDALCRDANQAPDGSRSCP
jgi:DNA invertase Pin-like site-specific DNA recombinase